MTTGEQLDNISKVTNVPAWEHLLNPNGEGGGSVIIQKIKSFKVVYSPETTIITRNIQSYKLVVASKTYKVVYIASPTTVSKLTESTIIKKGC